jgi:hypothetical protein
VYRQVLQAGRESGRIAGYPDFESGLFTKDVSLVDVYDRYVRSYSPSRLSFATTVFSKAMVDGFSAVLEQTQCQAAVDTFIKGLYDDRRSGLPLDVCFRDRARALVGELFATGSDEGKIVLEKTPHNILVFDTVKKIFPEAKCVHVIRDPRAVAESLTRQSWGSKTYKEAVMWVRFVLDAWINKYTAKDISDKDCLCIRMEDLILNYKKAEDQVRGLISERFSSLTLQANEATLNGWRDRVGAEDIEFGNQQFKRIMEFFGYSRDLFDARRQSKEYFCLSN